MRAPVLAAACALLALAAVAPADAATVLETQVSHSDNVYRIRFAVVIDAPLERVRAVMTDFAQLTKLTDTLIESEVLTRSAGKQRIRVVFRTCVLFFCKQMRKTEDVETLSNGDIVTVAVPAESDFHRAEARWHLAGDAVATRVEYDAEMEPRFFVPPLIGPALVKSKIRRELIATAGNLERLAQP